MQNDYSDKYNQYLSFVDLELDPEWNAAWKVQDKQKVEELLYKYGADIKYGWEVEVILHRPRTSNQPEYGPKINFVERTDKEFAPYVSTEDMIANTKDSFLKADLMVMSKRSNFSGALVDLGEDDRKGIAKDLIDRFGEEGDEV
jgi:hypothetical protein